MSATRRARALLVPVLLAAALVVPAAVVATASPAAAASPLSLAQSQVGVLEGSAQANSYGRAVGLSGSTSSYSWCATFISWLMQQSGANPVRDAAVGNWVDKARRGQDGLSVTTSPRPGDLVAFDWDGNGDYAYPNRHIGMVESVQSATRFTTIEGNTSRPGGGSDGVWRKSRSGSSQSSRLFIRVAGAATSSTPPQPRPEAPVGWYSQELPSPVASGTGLASQGARSLDAFFVDTSGRVVQRYYRGTGAWSVGADLGTPRGGVSGHPAAVSQTAGRLDVFVRTGSGELAQQYWSGGRWSGWVYPPVGGLATSPAVASWAAGRLDLLAVDGSGRLVHASFDGTWHAFRPEAGLPSGAALSGGPAAVSWGPGRLDVVAHDAGGRLFQTYLADGAWGPWRDLTSGSALRAAPGDSVAVSSWGVGRLDVFAKMKDGDTWHQWYSGGWSAFQDLATRSPNGPAAVSWGDGRVDTVYRSPGGALGHDWFAR